MDTTTTQPTAPRRWTPLVALILIGLAACAQGPTTEPTGTSVTIAPSSLRLAVGATATLAATVHGSANQAVTWSSAEAAIADVAADGTVTGVAAGTTTVVATSDHDPTQSASATVTVASSGPATVDWTVQFGTAADDTGRAVAIDSQGFIVVVGWTLGALDGRNTGDGDAFVRKYAPDGEEQWTRQFGTGGWDDARAVALDADDNILVVGTTWGDLAGTHLGNGDVFVRQYSPDGDEGWTEQFGTAFHELGLAIAVDGAGGIVVAGRGVEFADGVVTGSHGFVRRYSPAPGGGIVEDWTFDPQTRIEALAIDASGDVLAVGPGWHVELGFEVYVAKLTPAGNLVWSGLYGTGEKSDELGFERDPVPATRRPTELWEDLRAFEDVGHAVAVDPAGNLFVTGYVGGYDTGTGIIDQRAFVQKLTPTGEEAWAVLFGDEYATYGSAIAVDAGGDVLFVGNTASVYGERTPPGTETFTRRLAPDGSLRWDDTFGESGWDTSIGLAIDGGGIVYTVGHTLGELGAPNIGASDVFLRAYGP